MPHRKRTRARDLKYTPVTYEDEVIGRAKARIVKGEVRIEGELFDGTKFEGLGPGDSAGRQEP